MPVTTITVASFSDIPITFTDDDGVDIPSLADALRLRSERGALIPVALKSPIPTPALDPNSVEAIYQWNSTGVANGTYTPVTEGMKNLGAPVETAGLVAYPDSAIIVDFSSGSAGGREINLSGLTGFPAPTVEWNAYPDADVSFTAAGMVITHTGATPGLIGATLTGPSFVPAGDKVVEIDFLGMTPGPSNNRTQSGVGLGAIDFQNGNLILSNCIMWNANGSVLASNGTNAPLQVAGRKHRLRIAFNAAVTVATLTFFEDANNDGSYTPMGVPSATVPVSASIADGINVGFDPGNAGPLTVSRMSLPPTA